MRRFAQTFRLIPNRRKSVTNLNVNLIVISVLLIGLATAAWVDQRLKAARLQEELEHRDKQIEKWAAYFFRGAEKAVTWPDVLRAIGTESPTGGAMLAWLGRSRRVADTERFLQAAHVLASGPGDPPSLEDWRGVGAADLGDEFFQAALIEVAQILQRRDG
jgi:hypothetical protein